MWEQSNLPKTVMRDQLLILAFKPACMILVWGVAMCLSHSPGRVAHCILSFYDLCFIELVKYCLALGAWHFSFSHHFSFAQASGKYRQEGKTYVVQDGDIIFFKFNVSGGGKKWSEVYNNLQP